MHCDCHAAVLPAEALSQASKPCAVLATRCGRAARVRSRTQLLALSSPWLSIQRWRPVPTEGTPSMRLRIILLQFSKSALSYEAL